MAGIILRVNWAPDQVGNDTEKEGGFREGNSSLQNKKNPSERDRFSGVDPAGLAPASLLVKGNMLLHTPRTRIHIAIIKRKEPFRKDSFR